MKSESLSFKVEVHDKDGRLLKRVQGPSESYVRQWNQLINILARTANATIVDTGGTGRGVTYTSYDMNAPESASLGQSSWGTVVGRGNTAVTINDYALETQCGQGTGANQVLYRELQYTAPAVVGSTCSWTVKRVFVNQSGDTISIAEIGFYVIMHTAAAYRAMAFRDVLGPAVDVPDGGAITVTYEVKSTV